MNGKNNDRRTEKEEDLGVKVDPEIFVRSLVSGFNPVSCGRRRETSRMLLLEYWLRLSQPAEQPLAE